MRKNLYALLVLTLLAAPASAQQKRVIEYRELRDELFNDYLERRYGTEENPLPPEVLLENCLADIDYHSSIWLRNKTPYRLLIEATKRLDTVANVESLTRIAELIKKSHRVFLLSFKFREHEWDKGYDLSLGVPWHIWGATTINVFGVMMADLSTTWMRIASNTLSQEELNDVLMGALTGEGIPLYLPFRFLFESNGEPEFISKFYSDNRDEIVGLFLADGLREDLYYMFHGSLWDAILLRAELAITVEEALHVFENSKHEWVKECTMGYIQSTFPENQKGYEHALAQIMDDDNSMFLLGLRYLHGSYLTNAKLSEEFRNQAYAAVDGRMRQIQDNYANGIYLSRNGERRAKGYSIQAISAYIVVAVTSVSANRDFILRKREDLEHHLRWLEKHYTDVYEKKDTGYRSISQTIELAWKILGEVSWR